MKKKIIAVICVLLSIVIAGGIFFSAKKNNEKLEEEKKSIVKLAAEIKPLEAEKKAAEEEIIRLNESMKEVGGHGTVSILFCGMSEEIYSKAYSDMKDLGIIGTLVVTSDSLPDREGLLSSEEIEELVSAGWKIIPGWSKDDGDSGISEALKWIVDRGYSADAVFIDKTELTKEREDILKNEGFTTFVSAIYKVTADSVKEGTSDEVWYPESMGYKISGASNSLNLAVSEKKHVSYVVSFSEEKEKEFYNEVSFPNMLNRFSEYEDSGLLVVTDILTAKNYHKDLRIKIMENEESTAPLIEEQEKKISEINKKIEALYEKYEK